MRTLSAACAFLLPACANAGVSISVRIDPAIAAAPVSGRLVVLLIREGSGLDAGTPPLNGPFWESEQPLFGVDVREAAPGSVITLPDTADTISVPPSQLAPGTYRVQARLDTQRADSSWRREKGNLFTGSEVKVVVTQTKITPVELTLDRVTDPKPPADNDAIRWFSVPSELLSTFRGVPVTLRAGVVFPSDFDPAKRYAAVYEVPGFGGNHESASGIAARRRRTQEPDSPAALLARSTFWIVLDPEGPNGHTLFADSNNNGPCARALTQELILALERSLPLIPTPEARLLRGHSSGGWSTLWLATQYPEVFGACWSTSPDPVDFRHFQLVDLYSQSSMYRSIEPETTRRLQPIPASLDESRIVSYRRQGRPVMTVEREARGEDILGPDNTSAQQWDSWFAVFGPRNAAGNPAALFDPLTGAIDPDVANAYRRFDIAAKLRSEPGRYAPIFRKSVRLLCGDQDNFFLEQAVLALRDDLQKLDPSGQGPGYITLVPGADHGSIFGTPQARQITQQMVEHGRTHGWLHEPTPTPTPAHNTPDAKPTPAELPTPPRSSTPDPARR